MRIRTITCHDVCNYGASLQAYALMRHLQGLGNEVEIIDYLPYYKPPRHSLTTFYNSGRAAAVYKIAPWLKRLMAFWQNRHELKFQKRRRAFEAFKAERLITTGAEYHNNKELEKGMKADKDMEADLYIAGSDQIWNPFYGNGRDPAYYCAFVDDPRRCISYAASFGKSNITGDDKLFAQQQLANFRAISVRETTGVKIARSMGFDAVQVVDPVFLLSRDEWDEVAKEPKINGYVLVYDFLHNDPRIEELARHLARKEHLKIVSVNDGGKLGYADMNINDAGPAEFLGYVRGASYVLASSFHAAAFSTIFKRDFYIFPLVGHDNSSRMTDFLNSAGLGSRFITQKTATELGGIDFGRVDKLLGEQVEASKQWLEKQLENN